MLPEKIDTIHEKGTAAVARLVFPEDNGFTPLINVSGTISGLGASMAHPAVAAAIVPDPTGDPLERLRLTLDPGRAGASAAALAKAFAAQSPSIIVRGHEVELGYVQLDPCNLAPGHAEIVAERLPMLLRAARQGDLPEPDLNDLRNAAVADWVSWLDWERSWNLIPAGATRTKFNAVITN